MSTDFSGVRLVCDCGKAFDPDHDDYKEVKGAATIEVKIGLISMRKTFDGLDSIQWKCGACSVMTIKPLPTAVAAVQNQAFMNVGGSVVGNDMYVFNPQPPQPPTRDLNSHSILPEGADDSLVGRHNIRQTSKNSYAITHESCIAKGTHQNPVFHERGKPCKLCGFVN